MCAGGRAGCRPRCSRLPRRSLWPRSSPKARGRRTMRAAAHAVMLCYPSSTLSLVRIWLQWAAGQWRGQPPRQAHQRGEAAPANPWHTPPSRTRTNSHIAQLPHTEKGGWDSDNPRQQAGGETSRWQTGVRRPGLVMAQPRRQRAPTEHRAQPRPGQGKHGTHGLHRNERQRLWSNCARLCLQAMPDRRSALVHDHHAPRCC